jgi:FkbM family methyltransferase
MISRFLWRAFTNRYRESVVELSELRKNIKPDSVVCDIGANKGSYIYWFSKWAKQGKVVAFEPQQPLVIYLQDIVRKLNLNNVIVEGKAVSSVTGNASFYIPGGGYSLGSSLSPVVAERDYCEEITVETITLDKYFSNSEIISALKIDVEGAELDVFKGAERILSQSKPFLVFECENRHLKDKTVYDIFHYLYSFGYTGDFVLGRKLIDIDKFDIDKHQKQDGERFWDKKDYVNNFIFYQKR